MSEREVKRCGHCRLVQFVSAGRKCVKCRMDLAATPKVPVAVAARPRPAADTIGACIRRQRVRAHLSQRDVAAAMGGAPRSWISKLENDKICPRLDSARRLAAVLGCGVEDFMPAVDSPLLAFMAEIKSYLPLVPVADREQLLATVRAMHFAAKGLTSVTLAS